ncbi:metallophosphoesterase [Pyxidicoccus sp. 3LFB2]
MGISRRQFVLGGVAALAATQVEATVRSSGGTWEFELSRVDVALPGLDPAHEGLRIAQLSDLHVGPFTPDGRIIHAVRTLEREGVDLVVLTGDYVTRKGDPLERVQELLTGIRIPAFAVLGNHDHWTAPAYLRQGLERANITVLQNTHTVTRVRGAPLTVLGVDDARSGHADVEATFRGPPRRAPGWCSPTRPSPPTRCPSPRACSVCRATPTAGRSTSPASPSASTPPSIHRMCAGGTTCGATCST